MVALVTSAGRRSPSASALLVNFDYDHADKLQFVVDTPWIERHQQPLHRRASTASRCRCCILTVFIVPLVIIYCWNHFPEPQQPQGVPDPDPDPRDRAWSARSWPRT